jgi:DNA/RNA-binding domain of Phe-tRNA-synthetase-like protein
MDITIALPGVKLGFVEADEVRVAPTGVRLNEEMQRVCDRLRGSLTVDAVAALDSIRAVRAMFRAWEMDPARYRPSSEALLRRVVQGKGLYRVSNVVDLNNLGSIETGWPFGNYDRDKISPPVQFRAGNSGEKYERIGKQAWHVDGRPVLADAQGPFGSPISDSTRTMITEATINVLMVIFAPLPADAQTLERALADMAARLERYAGARAVRTGILLPAGTAEG